MKVVAYSKYGTPDVIEIREIEKPTIKENEMLIKVHAGCISPAECAFRAADPFITRFFSGFFKPKAYAGDMLSGEVVEVGSAVTKFQVGDRVFGTRGTDMSAQCEYVTITEQHAFVKIPEGLDYFEAAALADGGITALPFLRDTGGIKEGMHVLINGASGSVGTYAIQLAKLFGASVTAVNSGRNKDLVVGLGADYFIDYKVEDFTQKIDTYDIIFDAVGKSSFSKCKQALKANGVYMSTVPTLGLMLKAAFGGKKGKQAKFSATGLRKPHEKEPDLEYLAKLAVEDKLKTIIDRICTFEDIKEAHTYVDSGRKRGNVILSLTNESMH